MNTGISFPMDRFEQMVRDDSRILGVWYTGSQGRGTMDRFSDLDIKVWLTGSRDAADDPRHRLLALLDEVHFMYPSAHAPNATAFVGPDWQRVDLDLHWSDDLAPGPHFAGARVVKDTDGTLARLITQSPIASKPPVIAHVTTQIEEAIDGQIYLALHNARGAHWSAMGEVTHQAGVLYTLLAATRGRQSYGFRYVEQILNPSEYALLAEVWPGQPDREEIRRAARALWRWTRFVWDELERTAGHNLAIRLNEDAFLAAIDRIYMWDG